MFEEICLQQKFKSLAHQTEFIRRQIIERGVWGAVATPGIAIAETPRNPKDMRVVYFKMLMCAFSNLAFIS